MTVPFTPSAGSLQTAIILAALVTALHVTALLVSGLEEQDSTLGKDSFPKQIP